MASQGKRQNAGNKAPVALPNSGPPPPSPTVLLETTLTGSMDASVRVTTAPPISSTYEGLLYTADLSTQLIVLSIPSPSPAPTSNSTLPTSKPASPPTNTFKILPISLVTSCTRLSPPTSTSTSTSTNANLPPPQSLDIPTLTTRLTNTISHLKAQDAKRGRGVTREAQDIFDGISRTYPARWAGTAMVVNENVVIDQPYSVEDCRLLKDASGGAAAAAAAAAVAGKAGLGGSGEQALLRIRKVLAMEREKLALRRGLGTGGLGLGKIRGGGAASGLAQRKGG